MRAYTLDEIDRLRETLSHRWTKDLDCWDPSEMKEDIERELRTALSAGVEPPPIKEASRKMNSRPIIVGDRVSHYLHMEGTVEIVDPTYKAVHGIITCCRVKWDSGATSWEPEFVLNLIGDKGRESKL